MTLEMKFLRQIMPACLLFILYTNYFVMMEEGDSFLLTLYDLKRVEIEQSTTKQ